MVEPIEEIQELHKKCQNASRNKEYLRGQIALVKSIRNVLPGLTKKHIKKKKDALPNEKKWEVNSRGVLKDLMEYIKMRDRMQKEWLQDQSTIFHTCAHTINKLRKENNG
jgi:hypothetical protein